MHAGTMHHAYTAQHALENENVSHILSGHILPQSLCVSYSLILGALPPPHSHRKGGLLSRAEIDVTINGHLSSYVLPFPKISSSASAVSVLVACAQCDPMQEKPRLVWERATVAVEPFNGLMRR